ncbi:MAG: capsule biosynthesis protein [Beijerinckiaceae bacterium]|nr:capsule biosynthesis protein [Beijerinckiaceae bacterium]
MKNTLKKLFGKFTLPKEPNNDSLVRMLAGDPESWKNYIESANGMNILIATSMANYNAASMLERALAVALTMRGARVDFLLCDSVLPACQMTKLHDCEPQRLLERPDTPRCADCLLEATNTFDTLRLRVFRFSQYLTDQDLREAAEIEQQTPIGDIPQYSLDGLSVGEHAYAGALRYYGRADLEGEPLGAPILRRFLRSALLSAAVMKEVLRRQKYDVVVFHHGIYAPQGIIGEVCRSRGVRVVNWNPSYRKNTFIFSHQNTYHHTMITESVSAWDTISMTAEIELILNQYLTSRREGSADWIWFHETPKGDMEAFATEFGIDWRKPCIGLLTSVMWDAQLHYEANAFPSMMDWIVYTIECFRRRPELQLLIRVHPAEVRGMVPSRQRVVDELNRLITVMPDNVFVVPPENQASTYALMDRCDTTLIFNTKTGIELSAIGIPVIVAGEAWIRGKGFSIDVSSADEYERILEKLPLGEKISGIQLCRARQYAFHFFFRRMIELPFIVHELKFSLDLQSLVELSPGSHEGLDIICDGILNGSSFVYPYEGRCSPAATG